MRNLGQPELSIVLDEQKMGLYGVTTADANSVIEMAIGGKEASTFYQQERKFDIRIRYPENYATVKKPLATCACRHCMVQRFH